MLRRNNHPVLGRYIRPGELDFYKREVKKGSGDEIHGQVRAAAHRSSQITAKVLGELLLDGYQALAQVLRAFICGLVLVQVF